MTVTPDPRVTRRIVSKASKHTTSAQLADTPSRCRGAWAVRLESLLVLFLKKLVSDVLDRIDQFPDFDPRRHYELTITSSEMNDAERAVSVDDIELPQ